MIVFMETKRKVCKAFWIAWDGVVKVGVVTKEAVVYANLEISQTAIIAGILIYALAVLI
jgi:hypothetical protein